MLTFDQVKAIQNAFIQEYVINAKWREYVNMCGISKKEKNRFCLKVGLRKPLPPDMNIPSEYKGVKVFVENVGEIRPL